MFRWNTIGTTFYQKTGVDSFDEFVEFTSVTALVNQAFRFSSFEEIGLPNDITQIGQYAFCGMTRLKNITIPATVTSIGFQALRDCSVLSSVTILATTPPTLPTNHGLLMGSNNAKIYVPSSSVDTYKSAAGWSAYASRIFAIE